MLFQKAILILLNENSYRLQSNSFLVYFQGFRGPNGTLGAIGKPGPKVGQQKFGILFTYVLLYRIEIVVLLVIHEHTLFLLT